ncbi:xylulokinase [Cellvibrio japonicus]|uniref:Xylulose kinase (Xylulokinase) n=1 Tax=Cellvibrio japonicus (strain Ueda107) TaxID=498211 RepID=B3PDA4_CELJU|nr:FGGY-family carbohydrate kinase [Cellvibrio japonicus]ACE85877.1 xylulose kinase (xylulokinase) [Cellvibrio japonicus Ueda107]QEI13360.1 carbohydrate kinase [Cellvibrio japonicus]QEI16934.1 carbohydrate kinase [Cellvibrio japonicus]QEI20512.1 carbohydrate kinase [Cellvibrio japonicus]
MLFLGIDVGSSSVKLSVLDGQTGKSLGSLAHPESELAIASPTPGFAEQDPDIWWDCVRKGFARLVAKGSFDPKHISAIGISYQMHGLVLVDRQQQVLRPAIIWCDSRAVPLGEAAFNALGRDYCFSHLLNSPGNFTAAKLRWVQENQPDIFARIHKIMLPGDFIAMKLSGQINTTASGLSEGTLWDFTGQRVAIELLQHWGMDTSLIPDVVPSFGEQSVVSSAVAAELGLREGVSICYRAGDQPNNAFSLNVLQPGEVAATAGTSGVIYGVTDQPAADLQSRVNTFLHVTNTAEQPRNGVLVCVNGCGRLYSWLRQTLSSAGASPSYPQLNALAQAVPVGSEGLLFHPFGNGAERIFQNRNPGAQLRNLDFNRHGLGHMVRAAQEGIVFSLNQGFDVLKSLGGSCEVIRAGKGNLFLSDVFAQTFANTTQAAVELFETDGAEGAARAAALGKGYYASANEAFQGLTRLAVVEPQAQLSAQYQDAYRAWVDLLP